MLWLAWRWGLVQSLQIRLLAMLHAGFLWLGIALALAAVSHALMAASGDAQSLGPGADACADDGLPRRHADRDDHPRGRRSQRPRRWSPTTWPGRLYWALQSAAVLRVAAALWPRWPRR